MDAFITAAGESLASAQSGLVDEQFRTRMAVSEARLDARVALEATAEGIRLQTVSLADITSGAVESSALSTIRLDFVAVADGTGEGVGAPPTRSKTDVIDQLAGLEDIKVLERILGGLTYEATFLGDRRRWIVTARAGDLIVRESIVGDREEG
jgi:hypothetical protein